MDTKYVKILHLLLRLLSIVTASYCIQQVTSNMADWIDLGSTFSLFCVLPMLIDIELEFNWQKEKPNQ